MLRSSRRLYVLDAHRVPYETAAEPGGEGIGRLHGAARGPELLWSERTGRPGSYSFQGLPFVGTLARQEELSPLRDGRGWSRGAAVLDRRGRHAASLWQAEDGSVLLPFDPDELVLGVLSERYVAAGGAAAALALARRAYYALRPALPRLAQLGLRRRYTRVQERRAFPRWPIETRLHELYATLLRLAEAVAGEPLPWISPWPRGKTWSLVLTHDVERRAGYELVDEVLALERAAGVRSAWYFVPERDYAVGEERVRSLAQEGFEVGLHGLRHDGRDLNPGTFEQRLPAMRAYAASWGAVGFRSPSTHRRWELMPRLGLDYDSSYSDVARYEPLPGGSCSWLPFFIDDLVELPITLPMDHTVFDLLGEQDERLWLEKAALLKREGGMALLLTHPDYLCAAGRPAVYARFLAATASDPSAWVALPREVSAWWRARAATIPVRSGERWAAAGEAAERAVVVVGAPRGEG